MKPIFIIIFCGVTFFSKAENIKNLIDQTKECLSIYHNLSPTLKYPIKRFNLSMQELKSIEIENDSVEGLNIIPVFQGRIFHNIDKIIRHNDFSKTGTDLFAMSPDNKLFNFSLFENTGGSHKSCISVIYYRVDNEVLYDSKEKTEDIFASDGYNSIDTIQANNGVKYLLSGGVQSCTTCYNQYITLVRFENNNPICEFSYVLNNRAKWWWEGSAEASINYDKTAKTISVEYETDDLTPDCFCEPKECYKDTYIYNKGHSYDEDEVQKYCRCVFKFNGKTFELIEQEVFED